MSADLVPATVAWGPRLPLEPVTPEAPAQHVRTTLDADRWREISRRALASGLEPVTVLQAAVTEVLGLWARDPEFGLRLRSAGGCVTADVAVLADGGFAGRAARLRDTTAPASGTVPPTWPTPLVECVDAVAGPAADAPPGPAPVLTVRLEPCGDGVAAEWESPAAALPAGLVADMAESWCGLLVTLAGDPQAWTAPRSPLRLPAAQERQRAEVNATAAPVPKGLLHEAVARAAALHPERTAVVAADRRLRYTELVARSRRIGRRLRELGARPGALVAVCMEKGWEQPVGILGVLESGAAWVPVDPELPAERRAYLLETTGAQVVLTQRSVARRLRWPAGVTVLAVDDDEEWAGTDDGPLPAAQGQDDVAYVLFTSGSTGRPKGVMVPHRGALNTVLDVNDRYGVTCEDRFLGLSAMSFDLSLWDMFGALCAGAALVLPAPGSERDPAHWLQLVRREGVTTWMGAPALFELFCEQVERDPEPWADSLRLLILGGDWIPLSLPARAQDIAPDVRFVSLGGNTEASILSCTYDVERLDPEWRSIPYGKPLANQTLHVLDSALRDRPVGVPGDLYIGGTGVALGYWQDPERTAAAFLTHPQTGERLYRTGDLGRVLPDGNVEFLGRADFQVKVDGHRIEPGEVEAVLTSHATVDTAVVTALPRTDGELGNQALAGYVTPAAGSRPDAEVLRAYLADRLPAYLVPAHLVVLAELPLTAHGKVDRRALPRPGAAAGPGGTADAPRTPTQALVAGLWSEILGVDNVGPDDSFFELGGNSLLGIRVMNRLGERLGRDLDAHGLFRHRTVAELSLAIDRVRADEGSGGALPVVRHDPDQAHEPFPLTDQQQAYCVGRTGSLASGNVSAHMYLEFEGHGLDVDRFRRAWQRVVDRHPMLRAVVRPGTMSQQVLASVPPYEMPVIDLRGAEGDAVRAGLAEIRERYSHEVRPVDTWPLFDVVVARLDGERFRVHFSIDALCADFASARVLFDDLTRFYADPEARPAPPAPDYRDYVLAAAELAGTERYRRSLAYWEQRLRSLPPAPDLPLARTPESVDAPRFVRRSVRLDAERWKRLVARAGVAGLTPAGVLLAVYAQALAGWARSPRFTLNVTNLNRLPLHPEVDGTVGEFASFALVEVDGSGEGDFTTRARRVQEQLWSDLSHSHVSGVQLLRELMRLRKGFDGALMPVVFTSAVPLAGGTSALLDGVLRQTYGITQTPQVWMDLLTEVQDDELVVNWDVAQSLFAPEVLDGIFGTLRTLLTRLADDEAAWSADEALGPVPEPVTDGTGPGRGVCREVPDLLVQDLFLERVTDAPDRVAVVASDRTLTYAQLHREACRVAHWLRARGARAGSPVAIVMDKGWEQIAAAYGVLYAGAPYLPVDAEAGAPRVRELLERCGVELVLTQRALRDTADGRHTLCVDDLPPDDVAEEIPPPECPATPADLAYVLFTSGSSGRPKGVMLEHRGVVNALRETVDTFGIGPDDRALALTALHHDMSVFDVFGVLGAGGTLVVPDASSRREAAHWADLMARHTVTVWNSVPAMMEMLLEHLGEADGPLSDLRLAYLGGDWLPLPAVRRLHERAGVEVVSVGGPTETTLWNVWHRVRDLAPDLRSVPYGTPIANTGYHILDERMRDRPVWATGEMYCSGVGLARGYWGDDERTAAAFVTHPRTGERLYRTGDLGRFLPDGTIEFMGRADFQIKVNGHRIEPGEVEAALLSHPSVTAAVVTGLPRPDGAGHRGLTAHVVPAPTGPHREAAALGPVLRAHLRDTLPPYMVPSAFVVLDALPLNANGKVDRGALPAPRVEPATGSGGPSSAVAEVCAAVWADVLGVAAVHEHANFFELGGDSVLATRIVARLRQIFASEGVSLRMVFLTPTVAELARAVVEQEDFPGRSERAAAIHLRIARMSPDEVARELSARRASAKGGV
ncbi:amino acid adenylation domain-containing protein [Streptomyces coerulescens]|uniref:Phenyloxazoline synthase MbtB n=1 Tax=Streptomyces coerulescens TaxID=29304 RepID=A0ABW0CX26_STRCD